MRFRAIVLALGIVLASGGLLAVNAQAGKDAPGVAPTSGATSGAAAADGIAALPIGWNVIQAQNCQMYYNTSTTLAYIVYATNGSYFWSTNWQFQNIMEPSCQSGHWLAFYVYDSTGAWSSVFTWTY
jgi:hypothetical protein